MHNSIFCLGVSTSGFSAYYLLDGSVKNEPKNRVMHVAASPFLEHPCSKCIRIHNSVFIWHIYALLISKGAVKAPTHRPQRRTWTGRPLWQAKSARP